MTMQHPTHPEDERLAALAGGDADVAGNAALRAHVDACDRCRGMVDDLALLRSALAELPDLVPSRPIQLLPPVAAQDAAAGGAVGWLRRLAMPAIAAGAGLALVGAVGLSGVPIPMQGAGGGAAPAAEDALGDGRTLAAPSAAESDGGATVVPAGEPDAAEGATPNVTPFALRGDHAATPGTTPLDEDDADEGAPDRVEREVGPMSSRDTPSGPWLAVLVAGIGLLLAGLFARFALSPRAG